MLVSPKYLALFALLVDAGDDLVAQAAIRELGEGLDFILVAEGADGHYELVGSKLLAHDDGGK